jgi:hypothetical protein
LTGTKTWRLSLAAILAFGWLLIPSAQSSPDVITNAEAGIAELNGNVGDLQYQTEFKSFIQISENKLADSKTKYTTVINTSTAYENAVAAEAAPLEEKTTAETNKTNQQAVVDAAYNDYLDAELAFDIAVINSDMAHQELQSAGVNGLASTVYYLERSGSVATVGDETGCYGTLTQNSFSAGGSLTCGIQENIIIKLTGQITVPSWFTTTKFAGYTDDGFRMYVDGQLAVDNWIEQGTTWSPYSPIYDVSVDKTLDVEIWWYNGGGPGSYHLGWAIPGGWTGAGCDYAGNPRVWGENFSCNLNTFSTGPGANQEQIDAYNSAYAAQMAATTVRDNKLTTYNTELEAYNSLVSVLNTKTTAYNAKVAETDAALTAKNNAITDYTNSLYDLEDAITDAFVYYEAQLKRELNIAIANAAAAQAAADAAKAQADAKAAEETRIQAEAKAKAEAEAKARAEEKAKQEAEAKSKVDAEAKAKAEEENRIRVEQESKEKARAEERERQDAEERAKGEAEAKAKAEAEANKPKPKPTDEPKPEPTDEPVIEPIEEPTPEPSPEPGPEPEPEENPWTEPDVEIEDKVLTALVPEKGTGTTEDLSGVIANLTSKDNKLVKLSPEQVAAVSQTLKALTVGAKAEIASDLGIAPVEVAKIAEQMADNPALAEAFVEFAERAGDAGETPMPFTLADAVTEVQTEAFLADPLGAVFEVDVTELLSNFSELGMDMTDDQREKAQEVIVPVILVSQIAGAVIRRNK